MKFLKSCVLALMVVVMLVVPVIAAGPFLVSNPDNVSNPDFFQVEINGSESQPAPTVGKSVS